MARQILVLFSEIGLHFFLSFFPSSNPADFPEDANCFLRQPAETRLNGSAEAIGHNKHPSRWRDHCSWLYGWPKTQAINKTLHKDNRSIPINISMFGLECQNPEGLHGRMDAQPWQLCTPCLHTWIINQTSCHRSLQSINRNCITECVTMGIKISCKHVAFPSPSPGICFFWSLKFCRTCAYKSRGKSLKSGSQAVR